MKSSMLVARVGVLVVAILHGKETNAQTTQKKTRFRVSANISCYTTLLISMTRLFAPRDNVQYCFILYSLLTYTL